MVSSIAAKPSKAYQRKPRPLILDSLSLLLTSSTLAMLVQTSEQKIFLLFLIGSCVVTYLAVQNSLQQKIRIRRYFDRLLFTPTASILLGLAIVTLFGLYSSLTWALFFGVSLTTLMICSRLVLLKQRPRLRLASIGAQPSTESLLVRATVTVDTLLAPTNTFEDWDAILIDTKQTYGTDWLTWLAHANMLGIPTLSTASAVEQISGVLPTETLRRIWLNDIFGKNSGYERLKRVFDVCATFILLPILLPLTLLIGLLVLLESGAPIFFHQERVGKYGKVFTMVKFRTMRPDAEKNGAAFASRKDLRVTRLGGILRKYRLDEIPQFWNVITGDMSIIGPRPEQSAFVEGFNASIHLYDFRHQVRPGISGWAQVNQGYAAGADETNKKLCYDLYYVKNISLGLDLKIIVCTIRTILTGFGAR